MTKTVELPSFLQEMKESLEEKKEPEDDKPIEDESKRETKKEPQEKKPEEEESGDEIPSGDTGGDASRENEPVDDLSKFIDALEDKPEDWQSFVETSKKRIKDNQSAFRKQEELANAAKKEIERLQQQLAELNKVKDDLASVQKDRESDRKKIVEADKSAFIAKIKEKASEDGEEAIVEALGDLYDKVLSLTSPEKQVDSPDIVKKIDEAMLAREEALARSKYADYDDVIQHFVTISSNEAVKEQWQKQGNTAEAAYQIGKNSLKFKKALEDPEEYRKQIIADYEKAKTNTKNKSSSNDLGSVNGSKTLSKKDPLAKYDNQSEVFETLGIV